SKGSSSGTSRAARTASWSPSSRSSWGRPAFAGAICTDRKGPSRPRRTGSRGDLSQQGDGSSPMNVSIIGTGHVGLITGACLAERGHKVLCVDSDERKIKLLKSRKMPIYEPGLEPLVLKNMKA